MTEHREFAEYVAARWSRLVRTAILLGCSPAEAEDVAQAALERCFVHWRKVRAAEDRDAYVHRVLINTFRSVRRQDNQRSERPVDQPRTDVEPDHANGIDSAAQMRAALLQLSVDQRAVVVLRYYVQLSESETCQVLGIPAGTAKSRLARALAVLAGNTHLKELREIR